MSQNVKMIPCRQCGKMYKPCVFCQEHNDVWRWRNFCCSLECAKKYVKSSRAYREAQNLKAERDVHTTETTVKAVENGVVKDATTTASKKKSAKNATKTTSDEVTNDKETTK